MNWLIEKPSGKAVVAVGQVLASFALAEVGVIETYGVSVSMDPDRLFHAAAIVTLPIFGIMHGLWAKWRHLLK